VNGKTKDIAKDNMIDTIMIAIPSLGKAETAEQIKTCMDSGIRTQPIPLIEDVMTGKVSVTVMQDVKIEDLLGRNEVKLDMNKIADQVTNKTMFVTGGSIGSEISSHSRASDRKSFCFLDMVKTRFT